MISGDYHQLRTADVEPIAAELAKAWQDPELPSRQYESALRPEMEKWRRGESIAPFTAFQECWSSMHLSPEPSMLDVGASLGHYSEVLKATQPNVDYRALDYSEPFADFARKLYPDIRYDVGDACDLPYIDNSFDVVLHSGCIMHIGNWRKAILEAGRVARRYVIFNRTPFAGFETQYFTKAAYGVRCLEIHFGMLDLLSACCNARLQHRRDVPIPQTNHVSFLFEKVELEPYASNPYV